LQASECKIIGTGWLRSKNVWCAATAQWVKADVTTYAVAMPVALLSGTLAQNYCLRFLSDLKTGPYRELNL
jgi:hypothetical protein